MKLPRKILNTAFCTAIALGSGCGDKNRHRNIIVTPEQNIPQQTNQKGTPTTPTNSAQTSTQNTPTNNSTPTAPTQNYVALDDANNPLWLNEYIGSVRPVLTEQDTRLLESFVIQDNNGVQTVAHQSLDLSNSRLMPIYGQDERDIFGLYLFCRANDEMFNYNINFENGFESTLNADGSLENLIGAELKILGRNWKIFKAGFNWLQLPYQFEMILLSQGIIDNLQTGNQRTYIVDGKTYDLTVNLVTPLYTALTVNGQITEAIVPRQSYTLVDGAQIGVKEINGDQAEIWLSTEKIELTDPDSMDNDYAIAGIKINNEVMYRGQVRISAGKHPTTDAIIISGIDIKVYASSPVGDVYVPEQDKLSAQLIQPQSMFSDKWDIEYIGERANGSHEVRIIEK